MRIPHTRPAAMLALALAWSAPTWLSAQAIERAAYVTVLDRGGTPVTGLGPSDFVVREDNVAREVLRVEPVRDPMQLALLVDNSQAAESYIRDLRQALPLFIRGIAADTNVRGRHQISVIALAARPTILTDYTPEADVAVKELERIFAQSFSGTYLLDGIVEVSQGIRRRAYTRPVIVAVVTEGPELGNRLHQQVLTPLADAGAALHVVVVGAPQNNNHERSVVLQRGTAESGGSLHTLLTSSALGDRMKRLAAELTSQHRVIYARPQTLIPPEEIRVSSSRADVTVRATPVREQAQTRRP